MCDTAATVQDDDDFTASLMCCACGGGITPRTNALGSSWPEQCAFTSLACATCPECFVPPPPSPPPPPRCERDFCDRAIATGRDWGRVCNAQ
eukprot:scaffold131143_cov66-Phaeocystis_antarctica.AAC.1